MQTEAEAFLQRIRAHPDDDAERLVFADWLDEQGDPLGRFIRVQLALAEPPTNEELRRKLLLQERELLAAHRATWETVNRPGRASGEPSTRRSRRGRLHRHPSVVMAKL